MVQTPSLWPFIQDMSKISLLHTSIVNALFQYMHTYVADKLPTIKLVHAPAATVSFSVSCTSKFDCKVSKSDDVVCAYKSSDLHILP